MAAKPTVARFISILSTYLQTRKIYKRAYKKYYARVMKGNMTREDFNAWVEHAAAEQDFTIDRLAVAKSAEEKARCIEKLREDLNRL